MNEVYDFFHQLFSSEAFMARWQCGRWTPFHGWLYILSNIFIGLAYFSIPIILFYIIRKTKQKLPFQKVFWLFLLFILACGFTHFLDALMFWNPVYRLSAIVLFITAIISCAALIGLYKVVPSALALKSPAELERIITERTKELAISNEYLLKANSELEEAQKLSEELLKQKDEFISIASHEMKTPITAAKGYTELLLLSLNDEDQSVLFANKAHNAIDRLQNLVKELLDASSIQNGNLIYDIGRFNIDGMVNETIENFQITSNTHTIQKSGKSLQQINGDRKRLQQVLINLLSNAVKYSPDSDKVKVNIEELDNKVQISIQDFGVGISRDHLNKVFERYYRAPEHAGQFPGLGIGLYISNNIIQRHGGEMRVESEAGLGSTFYFTLPVEIIK